MNLRAVAVSFCPFNTSFWPIFTEGVVMTLLGTLGDSGDRKPLLLARCSNGTRSVWKQ